MNSRTLILALAAVISLSACSATKFSPAESTVFSKSVMGNGLLPGDSANGALAQPGGDSSDGTVHQPTAGNGSGSVSQPTAGNADGIFQQLFGGGASGNLGQPTAGNAAGQLPQPSMGGAAGQISMPTFGDPGAGVLSQINSGQPIPVSYVCTGGPGPMGYLKPILNGNSGTLSLKVNGQTCAASTASLLAALKAKSLNIKALCPSVTGSVTSLELDANGVVSASVPQTSTTMWIDMAAETGPSGSAGFPVAYADPHSFNAATMADSHCDSEADPLVVHMNRSTPTSIALSPREFGIGYDILGRRNQHKPVQVSWFTNQEYGLLALPNAAGAVKGIDQLFGDNTFGPDHHFAKHGYDALAKFDTNKDGIIDRRDPVYSMLRVWIDRDRNGVADPSELLTLTEADIAAIRLNYTTDFREEDASGNVANMKSTIVRFDGTLDIIFDLWLKYAR